MATIERAIPVGGASLNFKVVGGTTTPLNPADNTIWVNTSAAITGWAFSATDPSSVVELTGTRAVADAYLDASGTQKYHSNFSLTDYLALPAGATTITTNNATDTSDFYHAFYNAGKTLISTVQRKAGEISYDVPAGAAYVRLSLYDQDALTFSVAIAPAEGTVWVQTGTEAAVHFNALKKNAVEVYPQKAAQFVGGVWVQHDAVIYQAGAWIEWATFLYKYGAFKSGITDVTCPNDVTKVTKNADNFTVYDKSPGSYFDYRTGFLTPAYDFTDVNTLRVVFGFTTGIGTSTTNYNMVTIGLTSSAASGTANTSFVASRGFMNQEITDRDNMVVDIDVSAVSGAHYVAFMVKTYNTHGTLTIRSVECL